MTDHDDLSALLQQAFPPVEDRPPTRDVWSALRDRRPPRADWTWIDLGAAAAIAILLSLFPEIFFWLLYHL